jgi:hypothetical protein
MKKFLQLALKITILITVCSVLMNVISAYHLLADVNYGPIYKQVLIINIKLILLWIAIFIIGAVITSVRESKRRKKRTRLSRRLVDRK